MSSIDPGATAGIPGDRPDSSRVAWVEIAKGWCIVLVVMMHSALGVGLAVGEAGWLHAIVAFAKPFRMPDFFMVAGLFLGRAIDLPWRIYLDRKAVNFLYFYALWLLIVLGAKAGELGILATWPFLAVYAWSFVEPFSSMWFIYLLPFLFVSVRLAAIWPVPLVLAAASALHIAAARHPDTGIYVMNSTMTGWIVLDSFSLYLVYFLIGHYGRTRIFMFVASVRDQPVIAAGALAAWGLAESLGVAAGLPEIPGLTLVFGIAGALAIVAISALMAKWNLAPWLAYCGRNSLVIYLAFVLPMAATRIVLLRTGLVADAGWLSLIVAIAAIGAPLALAAAVRGTRLAFLFTRPRWAHLPGAAGPAKALRILSGRPP